jgi:uncharacterized membrane protein
MEGKNKGLIIFGIILLLIGLVAYFYPQIRYYESGYYKGEEISRTYPYQNLGMVLVLAGIIFIALGFLYSPRKTPPPPPK